MTYLALPDTIESVMPRLVRDVLIADSTLAAFFGTGAIRDHDYQELLGPLRPPYLAVAPFKMDEKFYPTQKGVAEFRVVVGAYLPRQIPIDPSLAVLAAPSVSSGGSGTLTGEYTYAVSGYTATGTSYISPVTTVSLSSQKASITVSAGSGLAGRILWRTKAGRSYLQYLTAITGTTHTDDAADTALGDDLAPEPFLGRRLRGAIKRALKAQENLTVAGIQNAEMILGFGDMSDDVSGGRNCRVMVTEIVYQLYYDLLSRESVLEVLP